MANLLIWFAPLRHKDFYLVINIFDIIFLSLFVSVIYRFFYYHTDWTRDTQQIITSVFLVSAILSLIIYFVKNTYTSAVHRIYVNLRLLFTLITFLLVVWQLVDILLHDTSRSRPERVLAWDGYGSFNFLNLYWSLELVKIIE